jgi:hypothetical protein
MVEAAQASPSGGGRGEGRVRAGFFESYSLGVDGLGFFSLYTYFLQWAAWPISCGGGGF